VSRPRVVDAPGLAPSGRAWSQGIVAGGLVFVSGQVAWDEDGTVVGEGSVERQCEQVFDNVRRVLDAAGSSLEHLSRVTVYLTDTAHVAAYRAARDRLLDGIRPASTLVIVASLVEPQLLVEIDAIAVVPESA
jgi:enamine deaminase RidA (YjgF/YER057c/UK114 family)